MTNLPDALIALEAALDQLAAALVAGHPDAVLHAEEPVAAAAAQLAAIMRPSAPDRAELYGRLQAVRVAMAKCERLGRSSSDLLRLVMPCAAYSATGIARTASAPPLARSRA